MQGYQVVTLFHVVLQTCILSVFHCHISKSWQKVHTRFHQVWSHESFTRHTLQYTGISVTENPISAFALAMYSTFDHWQTWIDSNSTWRSFSSTSEAYSRNWLPCPRMFAIIWTDTISDYHLQKWTLSLSYSKHQTQEEWQQGTRKWQKSKYFLNLEHNLLHPCTG